MPHSRISLGSWSPSCSSTETSSAQSLTQSPQSPHTSYRSSVTEGRPMIEVSY